MTDRDLATLLRGHVRADEPPLTASADAAILTGRRALRRRRLRRSATGIVAAAAIAAIAVPLATRGDGDRQASWDPATRRALADYDASRMPAVIAAVADPVRQRYVPALPGPDFAARDDQGAKLPERLWGKASEMDLGYGSPTGHWFRVMLMHARSEAEGDARQVCRDDLESGYKFVCEVSTAPNGDVVTTSVIALRQIDQDLAGSGIGWGAVMRQELLTGKVSAGDPSRRPIVPGEIYFERSVESVHSDTFLTSTVERVKAPDLAHAQAAWKIPVSAMVEIVTDPALVIPRPAIGENGCPFTLADTISCG